MEKAEKQKSRILLVEDDSEIAGMLSETLKEHGFLTEIAESGSKMDAHLKVSTFDLILLDIMLPNEDGLSICRRLRARSSTPIIMVTALNEDVDRIVGLEIGADDYIAKPFNTRELIARVKALLRRSGYQDRGRLLGNAFKFNGWCINSRSRQLLDPEGVEISLTSAEFDVLLAFCENPQRILTRTELLAKTHAGVAGPDERSIDVHISRVRQKIEPNKREPTLIKTIRMGGYIFTPKIEKTQC